MRRSRTWLMLLIMLGLNLGIIALGEIFRQTVVPGWKKGPLIDPAAPYSPENAQLLFSFVFCLVLDVYVLGLALWRRAQLTRELALRWWAPWVVLMLSLVVGEGAVRAWLAVDMVTYFRPHPILHWVVRSDLRDFDNLTGGGHITTNHDGMRMPSVDAVREVQDVVGSDGAADDEIFRVVVTGDSSNFGHGVEGDEMWSALLEQILDPLTPRKVEVINASCPGWTTFQAVEDQGLAVLAYHPDLLIAGFNNDPGPDYFHDADRVLPPGLRRDLSALAWNSEVFLLAREVTLSLIRRMSPAARAVYTERHAGDDPKYGKLSQEEAAKLVPRVPMDDFLANLSTLDQQGDAQGYDFVWVDMPVNRRRPQLIDRYVNWDYRRAVDQLAEERGFPVVHVDDRWVRQRAANLHVEGHIFHPNAAGHRRLAQQVAQELLAAGLVPQASGSVKIDGPEPAPTAQTLRLGWSSRTPVHAFVGAVLRARPELAAKHGLDLADVSYADGETQGVDVSSGKLDAFFSCEIPAIHMLQARSDARIVATAGSLGRIAVVARKDKATQLSDLKGARVGLAAGSTPAMDWETWGAGLGVTVVNLRTDQLGAALAEGRIDAAVSWDPWVELWIQQSPGKLGVVAQRSFRSVLALSVPWALPAPADGDPARAQRLQALVEEALAVAASDRPHWDAVVAELSGWPRAVVTAVADRNELLSGSVHSLQLTATDHDALDRASVASGSGSSAQGLFGTELLQAQLPAGYNPLPPKDKLILPPGQAPPAGPPLINGQPPAQPPPPPRGSAQPRQQGQGAGE